MMCVAQSPFPINNSFRRLRKVDLIFKRVNGLKAETTAKFWEDKHNLVAAR